ncbi:MAG: FlgD immunoglobulin-like domain containing protein [bacterium]
MKAKSALGGCLLLTFLIGCSEDNTSLNVQRDFEGITQRDEWGDTLAVDADDWVIVGPPSQYSNTPPTSIPYYRNFTPVGSYAGEANSLSIGAFPNPFMAGAGRLLIELILPAQTSINLHVEDESGNFNRILFDLDLSPGYYTIPWDGKDANGLLLAEGIYRIFLQATPYSSYGDVQIIVSTIPDPPGYAEYVQYAQEHYSQTEYLTYEYQVATNFGWDGQLGGGDVYSLPFSFWETLTYTEKFLYFPVYMNYDLDAASFYQYHYLLAYKHFQFGAGWPDDGDVGIVDTTKAQWQKSNAYHNTFVDLFEEP